MEAPLIVDDRCYDRTLVIKLQEYIHFGNIIKIFIILYSTKTICTKYVDMQYSESSMLKNGCKNAHPQRWLRNFSPVKN